MVNTFDIVIVVVVLSTDHVKYFQLRSIGYGAVCDPCLSFLPVCIRTLFWVYLSSSWV